MATANSVAFGLSSAQGSLNKKTNTDVMMAMKTWTEETGWLDDTPDIRIKPSSNEMRLIVDINKEVGVASIAEGDYEAVSDSTTAEEGTLSAIQLNARYSFSLRYKKGFEGKGGEIEKEVRFKAMKKVQAFQRRVGQQYYGTSTATVAVVKTTASAGATTADLALKDPYGNTSLDDTSANGLRYLSSLFPKNERIALIRSAAIIEIGQVTGAGSSGDGFLAVTWNASCTPTAGDQIVFANAVTTAVIGGTDYNKWPVGLIDATTSASVHGMATSSIPGWASYSDTGTGRWSVARQKKMSQRIMSDGGVKADRLLMAEGVERDIEAGESAARRYTSSDSYDLDASFKAKGFKVLTSPLVPPGVVAMWGKSAWTKKFLNAKPPEEGGPDLFDVDKAQDRSVMQASLDFIWFMAVTNRAGMGIALTCTEQ